jgi:hypothetical protein
MRHLALAAILLVIGSTLTPAVSEVRILASPGGEATAFLSSFSVLDRFGERVGKRPQPPGAGGLRVAIGTAPFGGKRRGPDNSDRHIRG